MVARYYVFQVARNENRWVDSPAFLLRCEENPEDGFKSDSEAYNFMRKLLKEKNYHNSDLTIIKTYRAYKEPNEETEKTSPFSLKLSAKEMFFSLFR